MSDEQKPTVFTWVESKEGVRELYVNYVHPTWTLYDIRLRLGQLVPAAPNSQEFVIEERAAVTLTWEHAKAISQALNRLIESYESVNGEIKKPKLVPAVDLNSPASK